MLNIKKVITGIISIIFLLVILFFLLDYVNFFNIGKYLSFLQPKELEEVIDKDFPTELKKITYEKKEDKLIEWEERLAKKEEEFKLKEKEVLLKQQEIEQIKENFIKEKQKLDRIKVELNNRKDIVKDLANKVVNMQPITAVNMMKEWNDYDIIDVIRQIDKNAIELGENSITPYLLSLFNVSRRSKITKKMLLPNVIDEY